VVTVNSMISGQIGKPKNIYLSQKEDDYYKNFLYI